MIDRLRALVGLTALVIALIAFGACDSGGTSGMEDDPGTVQDSVPEPNISKVTPEEGAIGTELSIEGSDFEQSAEVRVDSVSVSNPEIVSDTEIFATVPSGIDTETSVSVTVLNSDEKSATVASAFTAIRPELSFVNSATRPSGQVGSTVILDGRAFGDTQGQGAVQFSDGSGGTVSATIASEDDWTNTFIVTTVPEGAGDGPVRVQTEVGVSDPIAFDVTDGATFSPSEITWSTTTGLPTPVSGHVATYVPVADGAGGTNRYVYVTGGRDSLGTGLDEALYGPINDMGEITGWTASTPLPHVRSFHASVAATPFDSRVQGNGYLYVLGGTDDAGDAVSSVSRATINDDGTVGAWSQAEPLPQPLHSAGAAVFRSAIYVVGGATTGDQPVATVYKAEIDTVGRLSSWEAQTALPSARAHHSLASFGGYLYSVGGDSASVSPDAGDARNNDSKLGEVVYGRINLRSSALEGWTVNADSLGKVRSKHSTLVSGGYLFVSSGLYSAANRGSSENTYAQIFSDGTVDAFSGATGSYTLQSEGGTNLFNQASISYVDGSGVAHVLIIGGDDVNNPGNKQADVLYY